GPQFCKHGARKVATCSRRPTTRSTGNSDGSWIQRATKLNSGNRYQGNEVRLLARTPPRGEPRPREPASPHHGDRLGPLFPERLHRHKVESIFHRTSAAIPPIPAHHVGSRTQRHPRRDLPHH